MLALFNADGSNKNWLTLRITPHNVVDNSTEFGIFRLENKVGFIVTNNIAVGRNWHHVQIVRISQFSGFGLCGTSHARKLVVHTEVVLQSNCCKSLVLFVDAYAFFGFNSLVNTFAPTTAFQDAASELIDNLYVAGIDDVILVATVQLLSPQRHRQLVNQVLLNSVVQVVKTKLFFNFFNTDFRRNNNSLVFFYFVVNITLQNTHNGCELVIHVGCISDAARNDKWRTRFVNKNAVYFVNNGEVMATLHLVIKRSSHVVAQIVETEFVVRSVRDVTCVVDALFSGRLTTSWNNQANTEPHELMNASHPFSVESRQVIVDRDDMHAIAGQAIEIRRQSRHKGLSFTRLHFCNPSEVKRGPAHQLHIEMALSDNATRCLANNCKRFNKKVF